MASIVAKDISYTRGDRSILSHIDFSIGKGEIIVVIGPSGSGKTTLLRILGGILTPSSGHVDRSFLLSERNQTCGYHFIDGPFLEYLSVRENLLSLELFCSQKLSRDFLEELSVRFGVRSLFDKKISSLSSGQRERVSLIRAFLHHPEIVFLDEPGSNLDALLSHEVSRFLLEQKSQGVSLVISTHDPFWKKHADRVILLSSHDN